MFVASLTVHFDEASQLICWDFCSSFSNRFLSSTPFFLNYLSIEKQLVLWRNMFLKCSISLRRSNGFNNDREEGGEVTFKRQLLTNWVFFPLLIHFFFFFWLSKS